MASFGELLTQIDSLKGRLDALRPLDQEREARVMQKFRLWWTYHSNAIEGNSLTQGETTAFLMEGLTAKNKPLKDHLDLRGHSDAINYLLDLVRNKEPLTEAGIRAMHQILLVEPYKAKAETADGRPTEKTITIGQYKTSPNHVRTPTGETHYYATPEDTPIKMHELMDWYRDMRAKGEMHPVELAARYHYKFTAIHPFDDGNGRMSRILMNLMLMQAGYPPAVIRIGERDSYLAALRRADVGEDEDFLSFIAEHVVASLDLFIRAAEGEDVQEPTDLEKEIALLKMSLGKVEEPEILTLRIQKKVIEEGFDPLFSKIARLMHPLTELFLENKANWFGTFSSGFGFPGEGPISQMRSALYPARIGGQESTIKGIQMTIQLNGFKKTAQEHFDLSSTIEIAFESFALRITGSNPLIRIEQGYGEMLTKEDIENVSQTFVRHFVDSIKSKTGFGI